MDRNNDERRFYELVWPHMAAILRTAQCLAHCAADADDLTQETMVKAFKAIATLQDDARARPWLMSILRHARIDQLRREPEEARLELVEAGASRDHDAVELQFNAVSCHPDEAMDFFSDEQIIEALRELPKQIRWALLLVDAEGMGQEDAARAVDIPIGTVKSRLHRGRAMLREKLEPGRRRVVERRVVERQVARVGAVQQCALPSEVGRPLTQNALSAAGLNA